MERVSTLIQKLQQQLADNATAEQLLFTVQMLYAELLSSKSPDPYANSGIAVMMPYVPTSINEIKPGNKVITKPDEPDFFEQQQRPR